MRLLPAVFFLGLTCAHAQIAIQVGGKPVGTRNTLNFSSGSGMVDQCSDNAGANRVDCSASYNTAIISTHDTAHANENFCDSSNGTTSYTCKLPFKALSQYALGMTFLLRADASCSTSCSVNIDGIGIVTIKQPDGVTDPNGALVGNQPQWIFFDGRIFRLLSTAVGASTTATAAAAQVDQRGDVRARRVIGSMETMPYAATINLDVTAGDLHKTTTINSAGNAVINAATGGLPGQHMWIIITNDQISGKSISFGSNLRSAGALTGVPGKAATIQFVSDGTAWYEVGRTQGL